MSYFGIRLTGPEPTPATRETLRYRTALRTGFDLTIQRDLTTATALAVCSTIKARDMRVRALPGTRIANPATGEIIYQSARGKELIETKLAEWGAIHTCG